MDNLSPKYRKMDGRILIKIKKIDNECIWRDKKLNVEPKISRDDVIV